MKESEWDVIVIGAGPAGSTTAALLAEQGHRVLVLEREKFPRYHIGESLMPFCWFTLDRLGLTAQMDEIGFQQKHSVQFVNTDGVVSKPFYFFEHDEHPSAVTWQVERREFDQMIVEKARANGAEVREQHRVLNVIRDDAGTVIGVTAADHAGVTHSFYGKMVVDASGRDCLVAVKSKWRKRDPELNKVAIWTYFEGAMRDPGLDAGSTTVAYVPDKGWFWYIPMRDNRISVGVVADRDYLYRDTRDPAEILRREIGENEWIREHLSVGEQVGEHWVTGEYSYRSHYCAGDGVLLVGDAFAFLDPVFSSGVFLALKSGELAADAIHQSLVDNNFSGNNFVQYGEEVCIAIERMRKIVYAFYHPEFSFGKLIKMHPELRPSLSDLLIGNIFIDEFDELFAAVSAICELPEELSYGRQAAPTPSLDLAP
ncbi:MAG: tryptophan 7-halogenase [Verrucomicrobiales bacterium]|jgi:flavin-dependent dehydrogenase|nr:tryptophan 7-halogenase [Verrucomicrobiales bacterium]